MPLNLKILPFKSSACAGATPGLGGTAVSKPLTILIAEDDPGHARLIEKNLRRSGIKNSILRFDNGQEILDYLFRRGGREQERSEGAYLLLLDIRMPKVDGVQVLKEIKTDPRTRRLPIVMLTTTDDPNEVDRCHFLGCSNYIVKPIDYEQFSAAVQQLGAFLTLLHIPPIE